MQYVLLAYVIVLFAAGGVFVRRYQRRATRRLPAMITDGGSPLACFGGGGGLWTTPAASARVAGCPGLGLTLFPWGVRFGTTSRLIAWTVPTIELSYAELQGDAVRAKMMRAEGVRLRSNADPQCSVILWTSRWSQVLDALAYHGVPVDKQMHQLDWTYQ